MWYDEFLSKYKSGISHEFLLYFNVRDVVDNYRYIDRFLYEEFIKQRNFAIVAFYDISRGLTFLDGGMEREFHKITSNEAVNLLHALPSRIFPYIDIALKGTKMALFINHTEKILPSVDVGSMSLEERSALIWACEWSVNPRISSVGSTIFMLADNLADVSREVLKSSYRVEPILVGLPGEEERRQYIEYLLQGSDVKSDITIDEFAKLSSGLSKKSIKDIKLRAEAEDVPISFEFIKEKKHSVLQKEYGDVLEFIYPEISFDDIGGMDKAKNYLMKNIVNPIKKGDLRRVPMGILLCGPSGTGKTLLVNALAKSSGFNCVKIDMSRILGQYVGESEKNFKKCLLGAQSQQPVIVFVDEIDTTFRRGDSGDSGVGRNIFSEFLQFTSNTNNRGKVIFIAATNRPDLLDPALKRAGRFDKKIPILLPEAPERAEIFKIIIRKYGFETDIEDFMPFAEKTENYTGAEIETVVRKAYELANEDDKEGTVITSDILDMAIEKCRPSTQQVEYMTMLAIRETDDKDLLPEKYKHLIDDKDSQTDLEVYK
ncbi:AAA family ATPase [Clostridium thermosuccinogenes]|jgi:SpoVK/Ycf46/Vps4 family AAA+-type ATPase|uniref:AAA family ATPase n=1 Tax=Clostridium thermosuccinogenes TaxID=84032 RepID=A0A2K2FE73_9CLOT|nr:ATP-binding protein [Pseudoclostridium thermosuccinogenes]AUS98463.1 AAA family ATPase [Pseudoclostridium thermosuccinogenes]PNT90871.1 AAA family ATPase [Pseudoclostridium thermosuccinogenes]PNT97084.1 AAA family ATPase [Pseudoclostridium thermosuccinogenes]PNT99015.1 AAA family ATPase [Pseudoclostridium thermosuccinogenes]